MIKSKNFSTFVLDEDLVFLSNYSNTIWRKLHDKKIAEELNAGIENFLNSKTKNQSLPSNKNLNQLLFTASKITKAFK